MDSGKFEPLCIGDMICLYSEERRGYVFSYQSSSVHNELAVSSNQIKDFPVIPNIHALVFQICVQHRYKLNKKLPIIKSKVDENPSDILLQTQYAQAKKAADGENQDNTFEQDRQTGKTVLYGQVVQAELKYQSAKSAYFKVMPKYKVKSEGEVVQVQDQIVLESIKSPGQFLHIGRGTFGNKMVYADCAELNLSVISSGFTILKFFKPEKSGTQNNATKGGSMVRFYHREVEAYLCVEGVDSDCGEDPHLRIRRLDQTNPKSMYPSTSSITFWQIEKERSLIDGTEITWDDYVRIKHVVRRQYLMMSESGKISLTDDCQDAATLFRLHPVVKEVDYVTFDSAVRIQHAATGFWLHGYNEKPYVAKKLAAAQKVEEVEEEKDKKKKSKKAPEQQSIQPHILETSWSTAERRQIGAVSDMMYDDAFSLQIVEDKNVEEINFVAGVVPFLHKLAWDLCSRNVHFHPRVLNKIDMALRELQDFMIVDGVASKVRQKGLRNFMVVDIAVELLKFRTSGGEGSIAYMEPIFATLISLLSVYLQGNSRKNELYMGRHMDFFLEQIQDTTNYRYLDLLNALCVCDGVALNKNQNYITKQLLITGGSQQGSTFLITELGQKIGRRRNVVYISWDSGRSWQTLHDFTSQGRNAYVIDMLAEKLKWLTWEECYICLTDRKLADEIRAIYCRLLYDLFVNVGTNFVCQGIILKLHDTFSQNGYRPIPLPFMEPLKLWINDFLLENDAMIASEIGRNTLISEVLNLIRCMTLLHYYDDFAEVKAVLDPILGLLEGSDDLPYRVDNLEKTASPEIKELVENYQKTGRFKKNTQNQAMVNVKISACHAAELLFNMRSAVRLERFVSDFKQIYSHEFNGVSRHQLAGMLYDSHDIKNGDVNIRAVNMVEELFQDTNYVGDEFIPVSLDLCRYQFEELVAEAMFLLHRYFSSFEDLFENAIKTQILMTEKSKEMEEVITTNLRQTRLMMADRNIDLEKAERLKVLLNDFANICYIEGSNDAHPINQQMLYNHGVLSDIFDIITGEIETEEAILKDVMQSCFKLLKALARGNPIGIILKLRAIFSQIFAGNRDLCMKIRSHLVTEMVSMLAKSRSPTLIRLLSSLVMVGNSPLKRNQGLVIKALLQYQQSIDILTESTPESRIQLLTSGEKKKGKIYSNITSSMGKNTGTLPMFEFHMLTEVTQNDPNLVKTSLKWKPAKIHQDKEDRQHELRESLHYVFDAVLPFLQVFFKQYYQKDIDEDMDEKDSIMTMETDEVSADLAAQAAAERQIATHLLTNSLIPFAEHIQTCLATETQLSALKQTITVMRCAIGLEGQSGSGDDPHHERNVFIYIGSSAL